MLRIRTTAPNIAPFFLAGAVGSPSNFADQPLQNLDNIKRLDDASRPPQQPAQLLPGRIQTPQPLRRCEGGPSRVAGMLHPSRDVTLPVQHTPDIDLV
jgi:hypothetical protein